MIGADHPETAAMHEAGHAVVGAALGRIADSLHIREKTGRWVGDCHFPQHRLTTTMKFGGQGVVEEDTADAEIEISISVAGMLAQAKAQAEGTARTTLIFDIDPSVAAITEIVTSRDQSSVSTTMKRDIKLSDANGSQVSATVDGDTFSGADLSGFRNGKIHLHSDPDEVIKCAVENAMELLNNDDNWNKVKSVAKALVETTPSGAHQRHDLTGDGLRNLLL